MVNKPSAIQPYPIFDPPREGRSITYKEHSMKRTTQFLSVFIIIAGIFFLVIYPVFIEPKVVNNPEMVETFADPPVIGPITDFLMAAGEVAPWSPGVILWGSVLIILGGAYYFFIERPKKK